MMHFVSKKILIDADKTIKSDINYKCFRLEQISEKLTYFWL